MIAVNTTGSATSGNSSVCKRIRAMSPKTASATIETMVIRGRLIAKSEMNMRFLEISLSPRRVVHRADRHGRPRRHAARGAEQDGVAGGQTGPHLDDLVRLVA